MSQMTEMSSSFASCFRSPAPNPKTPSLTAPVSPVTAPPVCTSSNPNLTTCLYNTDHLGTIALTWCRHVIGRSLHIDIEGYPSFHLQIKSMLFWKKYGSKRICSKGKSAEAEIFWDLTKAKFQSGVEPQTGFYISIVVNRDMVLLVGDLESRAFSKTKAFRPERPQSLVLRREHVFGYNGITTKASFGGKVRDINIDCNAVGDDPRLCFKIDGKRVLLVKRLKWKFRGNEKVEVDGIIVHVSWDVFNWLFQGNGGGDNGPNGGGGGDNDGHAVFMFRFEETGLSSRHWKDGVFNNSSGGEMVLWQPSQQQYQNRKCGMNVFERKNIKKSSYKSRSSSSSSLSSAVSSTSSSSVMEWVNMDENDLLMCQSGFSLMVYVWKS